MQVDYEELAESEKDIEQLKKTVKEIAQINQWTSELSDRKKALMESVKSIFDANGVDSIIVKTDSGDYIITNVIRKGSAKWDATALARLLTPDQLEQVYSIGKSSSYVKVTRRNEPKPLIDNKETERSG